MAKKRKTAKAGRRKGAARRASRRKTPKRAAARRPARKKARKVSRKTKTKPESMAARLAHAVDAVLGTLTEAEQLHARTTRTKGFQELE